MGNQEIKCHVLSCRYNNKSDYCTLEDITVGSCGTGEPHSKAQTECASFADEG